MHPNRPIRATLRRLTGALVVLGAVGALTGCALLGRSAPAEVQETAESLAAAARAIPGVASAAVDVHPTDPKDRPNEWTIGLGVVAEEAGGLESIPTPLTEVLRAHRGAGTVRVSLQVPAGDGLATCILADLSPEPVARIAALRTIPGVEGVDGGTWAGVGVSLAAEVSLLDIMPELRRHLPAEADASIYAGWRHGKEVNDLFVTVSSTWPSDSFAASLEHLRTMPTVTSVTAMIAPETTAIFVDVEAERPDAAAAFLASVDPAKALSASTDTISYSVRGPGDEFLSGTIGPASTSP